MSYVDSQKLQRCYDAWRAVVAAKQGDLNQSISFRSGVADAEEGYKYTILEKGKQILGQFDWSAPGLIGSSKIAQMVLDLLGICTSPGVQQNLVDYRDVMYFADQAYSKRLENIEKGLYLLFADGNDRDAFNILSQNLNMKYALISYFFFLKDSSKYQVVRPKNFAERFPMMGADPRCAMNCSWENYQRYVGVLEEVRCFLGERQTEDVTLTDAHSFVWMFWMLSNR